MINKLNQSLPLGYKNMVILDSSKRWDCINYLFNTKDKPVIGD